MQRRRTEEGTLLRHLWHRLETIPGITRYGPGDATQQLALVSFGIQGWDVGQLARELDRGGVCCRPGLHCAPRAHRTLGTFAGGGTVRFGLSTYNTIAEIDEATDLLREIVNR